MEQGLFERVENRSGRPLGSATKSAHLRKSLRGSRRPLRQIVAALISVNVDLFGLVGFQPAQKKSLRHSLAVAINQRGVLDRERQQVRDGSGQVFRITLGIF